MPSGRDLARSSQRWMAAKSWRKKYSDLSGSSVICYCEPAKVVGSDHSEQQIAFWSTTPIFKSKFCWKIECNQSFYVYLRYSYFRWNAFGIPVKWFANLMCQKTVSVGLFFGTSVLRSNKNCIETSNYFTNEYEFCHTLLVAIWNSHL